MCKVGNKRSRRVSNYRSRQYVNHYNNKWSVEVKPNGVVEEAPIETVIEVIGEETMTEKEQTASVEINSNGVNPETEYMFWKYAAIIAGIGLGLFLLGSKD
ncbi:MAG: hypothetical protein E7105_08020 [Prevotella sp.]|nr:hypothetical protein [Prevotella sp.]